MAGIIIRSGSYLSWLKERTHNASILGSSPREPTRGIFMIYKIEFRVRCKDKTLRALDEEDAFEKIKLAMSNGCPLQHRVDVRVNGKTWSHLYDQDSVRRFLSADKTEMDRRYSRA